MTDREKVIKDLEECLSASCRGYRPRLSCPYNDEEWDIMRDALTLLKEQNDCENCAMAIEDRQMVIRCRDCKYGNLHDYTGYYICIKPFGEKISHRPDWFCADGCWREN